MPGAPTWARDIVLTELRREFPAPIEKADLQARTGLGTEDLRAVLNDLEEEKYLEDSAEGFVLSEMGYDPETAGAPTAIGQTMPADEESDGDPAGVDVPPEAVGEPEEAPEGDPPRPATPGPPVGETRYSAVLAAEVGYYPEAGDGEADDPAAVREAQEMAKLVQRAFGGVYPDLPVTVRVVSVQAFDSPRTVWPVGD